MAEVSTADWRRVLDVNLNAVFFGMREQIPAMITAGGGAIVNMASILASVGFASSAAYVTSKHGLVGLTKNAALEYAAQGIRVVSVGPGLSRHPWLKTIWMKPRASSSPASMPSAVWAPPRRLRLSLPSWPAMLPRSSPAAITWWTVATRPRDGLRRT